MSVLFIDSDSDRFRVEQSPVFDSRISALEAMAEATAFEMEVAIRNIPEQSDALGVLTLPSACLYFLQNATKNIPNCTFPRDSNTQLVLSEHGTPGI